MDALHATSWTEFSAYQFFASLIILCPFSDSLIQIRQVKGTGDHGLEIPVEASRDYDYSFLLKSDIFSSTWERTKYSVFKNRCYWKNVTLCSLQEIELCYLILSSFFPFVPALLEKLVRLLRSWRQTAHRQGYVRWTLQSVVALRQKIKRIFLFWHLLSDSEFCFAFAGDLRSLNS